MVSLNDGYYISYNADDQSFVVISLFVPALLFIEKSVHYEIFQIAEISKLTKSDVLAYYNQHAPINTTKVCKKLSIQVNNLVTVCIMGEKTRFRRVSNPRPSTC